MMKKFEKNLVDDTEALKVNGGAGGCGAEGGDASSGCGGCLTCMMRGRCGLKFSASRKIGLESADVSSGVCPGYVRDPSMETVNTAAHVPMNI